MSSSGVSPSGKLLYAPGLHHTPAPGESMIKRRNTIVQQSITLRARLGVALIVAVGVLIAMPGAAFAASAAATQYTHDPTSAQDAAQLPFTGFAVIAVLVIAMVLLSAGVLARRIRFDRF